MEPDKHKCSSEYDAGPDRLSEMPDEVIVHILSYLPIVDAVRTILIRPLGNLWTLISNLEFEVEEVLNKLIPDGKWTNKDVRRFYIFVRNVLKLYKRPFIDKFLLCLGGDYEYGREEAGDDIRMGLQFALDKQAKEIVFMDVCVDITKSCDYPNFISQSLVVVTLELYNCTIYPQLQVDLGSLKKLQLYCITMSEKGFQQVIRGCPSLQELLIEDPFGIRDLSFSAPNIRKLSLILMETDFYNDRWLFDFPNLKSLELVTDRLPDINDVSSVRDFHLKDGSYIWIRMNVECLKYL